MLQKLKLNLVLINIISLTVVLAGILISVYFRIETQLKNQESELLIKIAFDESIDMQIGFLPPNNYYPFDFDDVIPDGAENADISDEEYADNAADTDTTEVVTENTPRPNTPWSSFYVNKNTNGEIIKVYPDFFDNIEIIKYLIKKVDALKKNNGEVDFSEVRLSFLISEKPYGKIYVFVDRSNREETMASFVYFAAFVLLFSIVCVFIISMILANKAIKPIKESIEKQDKFIADASHELRTPLSVIRTNVELVMDSPEMTVEENMKWLRYIHTDAKRITRLTEDLLVLSRANTKREVLKEKIDLSRLIEEIFDSFAQIFQENKLSSEISVTPEILIFADEYAIRQLFAILIDNAIKYTNEGSIKINLEKNAELREAHITITDTGIGISQENIDKIFERFFRADKSRTKNTGGSGLGLSIAVTIAKEHGGKIDVKSELDKGSEFCVILPLAADL